MTKKYKDLESLKHQLENPKATKLLPEEEIKSRLNRIIKVQFIEEKLKYEIFNINDSRLSFAYFIDNDAFETLQRDVLGRQIVVTNRHVSYKRIVANQRSSTPTAVSRILSIAQSDPRSTQIFVAFTISNT